MCCCSGDSLLKWSRFSRLMNHDCQALRKSLSPKHSQLADTMTGDWQTSRRQTFFLLTLGTLQGRKCAKTRRRGPIKDRKRPREKLITLIRKPTQFPIDRCRKSASTPTRSTECGAAAVYKSSWHQSVCHQFLRASQTVAKNLIA
jgi:hypothetical protein